MHALNGSKSDQSQAFALCYGESTKALATVVRDERWPGMYRIEWPEDTVSAFGNLSRCRDAAYVTVARGRDWRLLWWRRAPKRIADHRWTPPSGRVAVTSPKAT
jgi:hypothetical protein